MDLHERPRESGHEEKMRHKRVREMACWEEGSIEEEGTGGEGSRGTEKETEEAKEKSLYESCITPRGICSPINGGCHSSGCQSVELKPHDWK
jgi:hypothetical protein